MKMNASLVSLLVAILALTTVSAAPAQKQSETTVSNVTATPTIAEALLELVTSFQRIMPCGVEDLNIPVLAPFRLPKIHLDIDSELLVLKGDIKDMVIVGINDLLFVKLASNSSSNRLTFDILYNNIQTLGEFDIHVEAEVAGFRFAQDLKGFMNVQVSNIRVTGGLTIGTNEIGGMLFSDLDYYVQVGDINSYGLDTKWSVAVNNFVNQYFRDASLLFLQTNRDFISQQISGYVTPLVNSAFHNISSSEYIQAMGEATQLYNAIDCSS